MNDGFRFQTLIDLAFTICDRYGIGMNNTSNAPAVERAVVAAPRARHITIPAHEPGLALNSQPEWARRAAC